MLTEFINTFWLPSDNQGAPTVPTVPMAAPLLGALNYAPITIYNQWPTPVDNVPIYRYLLGNDQFSRFVQIYYKISCAIVFKAEAGNSGKIIASGCLIEPGCVATARHAFDKFPKDKLFIRFFHYEIWLDQAYSQIHRKIYYKIIEYVLDIPVVQIRFAQNGLDAGLLIFNYQLLTAAQVQKYLPYYMPTNTHDILPKGEYAMFHFADGIHQVSTGNIYTYQHGMPLQDILHIQGGNGASGASIIWHGLARTETFGIAIYRQNFDGNIARRIIPYREFNNFTAPMDAIKNPYHLTCSNRILTQLDPTQPGYEFKIWTNDEYFGARCDSPNDELYAVQENFANNHIIPIGHMLYLWDYLHELDKTTLDQLRIQAQNDTAQKIAAIQQQEQIDLIECVDYTASEAEIKQQISNINQFATKACTGILEKHFNNLKKDALDKQYGAFLNILYHLTPHQHKDKTWFAWSYWNLFKGWNSGHRTLDPCHNRGENKNTTRDERTRPSSFNLALWIAVKNLFWAIENIKRSSIKIPNALSSLELELLQALKNLLVVWQQQPQTIHPYKATDWQFMGKRYDREQYILFK